MLVHFFSAVLISGGLPAFAQSERPTDSEISPYLLRVQRTTPGNTFCVLLRHDGRFHLETSHGDRTEVLVGSLPSSKLLKVQRMLDSDGLPRLSQDKPGSPKTRVSQILQISIFRTDHWQNLIFMDENGNQSIPRSLDPLLNWLGSLHTQPHQQLNEDESKNNCQSTMKIELTKRPLIFPPFAAAVVRPVPAPLLHVLARANKKFFFLEQEPHGPKDGVSFVITVGPVRPDLYVESSLCPRVCIASIALRTRSLPSSTWFVCTRLALRTPRGSIELQMRSFRGGDPAAAIRESLLIRTLNFVSP